MDKLVGIPICLIQNLTTTAPVAMILIAVGLFVYYRLSRMLFKKILVTKTAANVPEEKDGNPNLVPGPKELYDSTVKFAFHAAEFLVLLIVLIALCTKVGLIQNFNEVTGTCFQVK